MVRRSLRSYLGGGAIFVAAWLGMSQAAGAQTLTTIYNFCSVIDPTTGACLDGSSPQAGLVQATDGNFYGTAYSGGTGNYGTVFRITPSGTLTTTHSFTYYDGTEPTSGLIQATNGNLYGTTLGGGASFLNQGTVFELTLSGTLTNLVNFDGSDGWAPTTATLTQATNGDLYGTAARGGASYGIDGSYGYGLVFDVAPGGGETVLHSFSLTDGAGPTASPIQAKNGLFYGSTEYGGLYGYGTIYKMTAAGTVTTLHDFNLTDGSWPAGLIQAADGNFYGTTYYGGANNHGVVFKITPTGSYTKLHDFCAAGGICTDGGDPWGSLIQATDGNLYGTTNSYGSGGGNCGTIFRITTAGALTTLYNFCSAPAFADGGYPQGALLQATDGNIYGTTNFFGVNGAGTVFKLSTGLAPFVALQTTSGPVGSTVTILGNNLTRASKVTFNGTAAAFSVVSASEITATVPSGATSGKVHVVVPGRTLKSNVSFTVP